VTCRNPAGGPAKKQEVIHYKEVRPNAKRFAKPFHESISPSTNGTSKAEPTKNGIPTIFGRPPTKFGRSIYEKL